MAVRCAKANLFARGTVTQLAGTSNATLGLPPLYDGAPSWPWRSGAAAAANTFQVDGDLLLGTGGFESLTGWTVHDTGTGASALSSTHRTGTYSLGLTPGAGGVASRSRDITVYAGETVTLQGYPKGSGSGAGPVKVQALLVEYGQYHNGTTWQSSPTTCWSATAATFTLTSATLVIPDFTTLKADTVTLRITAYNDGTAASFLDDLVCFPSVDLVSIHGHKLLPRHVVTLSSSVDASAWTSRATPTIEQPAFFSRITPVAAQFWKVAITDALAEGIMEIGELFLGLTTLITATHRHPAIVAMLEPELWPQDRQATLSGAQYVTEIVTRQVRQRLITFRAYSAADLVQAMNEMHRRTRGGADPLVVIPVDTETTVMYARCMALATPERGQNTAWTLPVQITEEPGPSTGA